MKDDEARASLIVLWREKPDEAMASAELELSAGITNAALSRLYYACFYAVTALLLGDGKEFARHSAVKAEFNRCYVKSGRVDARWNRFYQGLFDGRQEADYLVTASFDATDVSARLQEAREFLLIVRDLINPEQS